MKWIEWIWLNVWQKGGHKFGMTMKVARTAFDSFDRTIECQHFDGISSEFVLKASFIWE